MKQALFLRTSHSLPGNPLSIGGPGIPTLPHSGTIWGFPKQGSWAFNLDTPTQ